MRKTLAIMLLGIVGWVAPGAARADFIYANTTGGRLIGFDSSTPGTLLLNKTITGVTGELVGIDFRPSTPGVLIGVGRSGTTGTVYQIDYASSATTATATAIGPNFTLLGTSFGVDFNPAANALRIVSNTGQNLRIPTGGTVAAITDTPLNIPPNDPLTNPTTGVVAAGYTNNFAGTTTTSLLVLQDNATAPDTLYTVNPPNAGTLTNPVNLTINNNPLNLSQLSGFDITADNRAFLSWNGGQQFGTLNFLTGVAVNNGAIGGGFAGQVAGITVSTVPEPASIAMVGMGGLLFFGWLRKRSS